MTNYAVVEIINTNKTRPKSVALAYFTKELRNAPWISPTGNEYKHLILPGTSWDNPEYRSIADFKVLAEAIAKELDVNHVIVTNWITKELMK